MNFLLEYEETKFIKYNGCLEVTGGNYLAKK